MHLVKRQNCQIMANEIGHCDSIVVGALGTITANSRSILHTEKYIENLETDIKIEHVQKSALLGIARIIRKVLSQGRIIL